MILIMLLTSSQGGMSKTVAFFPSVNVLKKTTISYTAFEESAR